MSVLAIGSLALLAAIVLWTLFVALFPVPKVPLVYNLRNLQVRWLTTCITALAISLVVALMTVMLMFVRGMEALTEGSSNPGNVVIIEEGATDEVFSKLSNVRVEEFPDEAQRFISKARITRDGKETEEYLVSREVYAIVTQLVPIGASPAKPVTATVPNSAPRSDKVEPKRDEETKDAEQEPAAGGKAEPKPAPAPETPSSTSVEYKKRFIQMRGIENPTISAEVHGIQLISGRWFDDTHGKQIVLGNGVARLLGKDAGKEILEPGDVINLRDENFEVVGVMSPVASTFGSEVWIDYQVVQKYFGRENTFSSYVLRINDPKKMEKVTEYLRDRDKMSYSFQALSEKDYYSKLSQSNQGFTIAINFVAIVMAIGGMLGVMITMFAAVSQRRKDIGVLRLLGYRRWQILASFLLESLVIGVLAGLVGIAIGSLFQGLEANSIVSSGQGGGKSIILRLTIDNNIILQGFLFSIAMGIFGGLIPSISAMRLKPLESLK